MQIYVQQFDCDFFATQYFSLCDKQVDLRESIESSSWDSLLKNIDQYTRLLECIVDTQKSFDVAPYDENMKSIKKTEVILKNFETSVQSKKENLFKLDELFGNNIVVAA